MDVEKHGPFRLDPGFLAPYRERPVPWGFGALSWVTYKRTYSRGGEAWWETCRRVIEGMFTVQRFHCLETGCAWDERTAARLAQDAYARLWRFQWTPPGRGLWIMGTDFMYRRGGAALNNCGFVSTRDLAASLSDPFLWTFRMSMLGVGVGFDTRGRGMLRIRRPARADDTHRIEDSREGWEAALERLLDAYAGRGALPRAWDFSAIRPRGTPLKSFGGYASGPGPLRTMLEALDGLFGAYAGKPADARLIVDGMNIIGRCVVAGGIRRSAQIALGEPDDRQFLDLKTDADTVRAYRWVSNNSVLAEPGMDYGEVVERTVRNGEPGYFWLDNARRYGRMKDPPDEADAEALGTNPCVEQTLWDRELCCLVETYPAHHDGLDDYLETLRVAYLYAKTVTLVPTRDTRTNAVMLRNRRIGCSMSGVVQAVQRHGLERFRGWCETAYRRVAALDGEYAAWLGVPRSIKMTSVKPSGTVSLLAGATPGAHWGYAPYYIRRVRIASNHPLAELCRRAGYPVEEDAYSENTTVVSFPVKVDNLDRGSADVSLEEKVELAAMLQREWSDNQVSCTIEFDPETEAGAVEPALAANDRRLKAIVFLPRRGHGYAQPPYEAIPAGRYEALTSRVRPLRGGLEHEEQLEARFCEGDTCELEDTGRPG
ncbi:MAG: fused protease/ribonucleoside-triphosphate reductase [Lentisphaerae bacterium]|nr:fused protease/ribonucleoside-triphosphate reductase [Lentisphaerota bacterium]